MKELAEGLWIVAGEEITHRWDAAAYLVTGEEPILIDCGSTEGYPALTRNLAAIGYRPDQIRAIYATHGHWDHLSAAAQLQAESGAALWIHEADRAQVESGHPELTAAFLYGRDFPPAQVTGTLADGDVHQVGSHRLLVHHTPGHTPGSVCFSLHLPSLTVLIAGDTLWGAFHAKIASDLDAWARSLDRLIDLEYDALTFGHGSPGLWLDPKQRVREARQQFGVFFNPWFKPFYLSFSY